MVKIIKPLNEDKSINQINHFMEVLEVEQRAWDSCFYKRTPQKITASSLIEGFCMMQKEGTNSLRRWAIFVGKKIKSTVTKQAIENRLNENLLRMLKRMLPFALNINRNKKWLKKRKQDLKILAKNFNSIIIQDSTIQQVPNQLYETVSGNKTSKGNRALMRIQSVYNFTEQRWENFSIDHYSDNDQSQAMFGFDKLKKRDLLIRDLGYFAVASIAQLIENQYVITPYKSGVNLYDIKKNKMDLLPLLREKQSIDMQVLVTRKTMLPMRLVAQKLSQEQKGRKIKEAKKKAHASSNYSDEYFELLGYEIYLTNIEEEVLSIQDVAKMYGLRWYIEIIFKAWKSHFNFKAMFEKKKMNYTRTKITMYLILLQFIYLTNYVYQYVKQKVEQDGSKLISCLKFLDVCKSLLPEILSIQRLSQLDSIIPQFTQHAVYEKRNKRKNMKQKYQYFNELELQTH